jgi:hypothetical protein
LENKIQEKEKQFNQLKQKETLQNQIKCFKQKNNENVEQPHNQFEEFQQENNEKEKQIIPFRKVIQMKSKTSILKIAKSKIKSKF